jgi:Spy/CpxP family protein refolding chaperone
MKRTMLSLLLLLGSGATALAAPGPRSPEARKEMAEHRFEKLASRLELDATQTAAVRATFEKSRAQATPIWQAQRATRQALKAELAAPQPNEARVKDLTAQLTAGRQQLQSIRAARTAELQQELTPQQFAKMLVAKEGGFRHGRGMHKRHGMVAPSVE